MKKFVFSLLLYAFPYQALAGGYVGNGGNSVHCKIQNQSTNILLDFFEAQTLNPTFKLSMGESSLSVDEKIKLVLNRLAQKSPERAIQYSQTIQKILNSNPFIDTELAPVDDSLHPIMPEGCEAKQLAIRMNSEVDPYERHWLINKKIYESLDNNSKAGLLLHEAIYNELIELGATNSAKARYFTAFIVSEEFAETNLSNFINILVASGFTQFDYSGIAISFYDWNKNQRLPTYYANGNIKQAAVTQGSRYTLKSAQIIRPYGIVSFYENGKVQKLKTKSSVKIQNNNIFINKLNLDEAGNITSACVAEENIFLETTIHKLEKFSRYDKIFLTAEELVSHWLVGACIDD